MARVNACPSDMGWGGGVDPRDSGVRMSRGRERVPFRSGVGRRRRSAGFGVRVRRRRERVPFRSGVGRRRRSAGFGVRMWRRCERVPFRYGVGRRRRSAGFGVRVGRGRERVPFRDRAGRTRSLRLSCRLSDRKSLIALGGCCAVEVDHYANCWSGVLVVRDGCRPGAGQVCGRAAGGSA